MLFGKLINFLKEPMNEERLTSACNLTSSHCHLLCKKPHKNRHWPPAVEAGVIGQGLLRKRLQCNWKVGSEKITNKMNRDIK
jgi:hypothetical protein